MPTLAADDWITMTRGYVTCTISRAEEKTVTTNEGETTFDTDICRLDMTTTDAEPDPDKITTRTTWKEVADVDPLLVRLESNGWTKTATGDNPPP